MVAIQSPRESLEWAPLPMPGPEPVRERGVVRRLPDRATRVRRRRLAVLVTAVVLLGAGALGAQALTGLASVGGSSEPRLVDVQPVPLAGQQYVVQPGDTLWSIANEIAPDDDPRVVVDALRAANGGPELEVGSRLTLATG
jgi:LysM domain